MHSCMRFTHSSSRSQSLEFVSLKLCVCCREVKGQQRSGSLPESESCPKARPRPGPANRARVAANCSPIQIRQGTRERGEHCQSPCFSQPVILSFFSRCIFFARPCPQALPLPSMLFHVPLPFFHLWFVLPRRNYSLVSSNTAPYTPIPLISTSYLKKLVKHLR